MTQGGFDGQVLKDPGSGAELRRKAQMGEQGRRAPKQAQPLADGLVNSSPRKKVTSTNRGKKS
jgi:hypothetical protein